MHVSQMLTLCYVVAVHGRYRLSQLLLRAWVMQKYVLASESREKISSQQILDIVLLEFTFTLPAFSAYLLLADSKVVLQARAK